MNRCDSEGRKILFAATLSLVGIGCGGLQTKANAVDQFPALTSDELFEVALLQAQRGDFFRAEQYLVAARAEGYDDATTTYWLVRVCVHANRYHSALHHAQDRLNRDPNDWRLRLVVASIHEALGEIGKAVEELEEVLTTEPGRALVHYRLGVLYGGLHASREAARSHLREYLPRALWRALC